MKIKDSWFESEILFSVYFNKEPSTLIFLSHSILFCFFIFSSPRFFLISLNFVWMNRCWVLTVLNLTYCYFSPQFHRFWSCQKTPNIVNHCKSWISDQTLMRMEHLLPAQPQRESVFIKLCKLSEYYVHFEAFRVVIVPVVAWVATLSSLVSSYWHLGGTCCPHDQGRKVNQKWKNVIWI